MYKYKMTVKEKSSLSESTFKSNRLQTLINDINACRDVSFIIKRVHDNRMMMVGSK